jgi:hypothetical protein
VTVRSLAITARYLSREECEVITKRALSYAGADETRVLVNSTSIANTRFAVNQISTGGDSFDSVVTVVSKFGKRSGSSYQSPRRRRHSRRGTDVRTRGEVES